MFLQLHVSLLIRMRIMTADRST